MRNSLTIGVASAALALGMSVAMAQAPQSSPPRSSGDAATTGSTGAAATKVDVSADQRTKLTGVVKKVQVREASNINVPVSVGSVLPSSVELVTIPTEILSIVPTFSS